MNQYEFEQAIALGKSRSDCVPANIDTLANIVKELRYLQGDIVECGSFRCGATIAMAAAARRYEIAGNPKKVYAFDTFGGLPYGEGAGFEKFANTDFEEIKQTTSPYEIVLVRGRHEDTVPDYRLEVVSMIFLDSDHYSSHIVSLRKFWPLLNTGGYAIFHDWAFKGVQKAIAEIIPKKEIFTSQTFDASPNMGYIVKTKR